jgi:tetratricopeptide (TPR) repeat protein
VSRSDVATCSGTLASLAFTLLSWWAAVPARAQDTCAPPVARIVSIQGSVEVQRAGQPQWVRITRLDTPLCAGDRVQTGVRSRAALVVSPETLVRLDQSSALSIRATPDETVVEFFQDPAAPREALGTACGAGYFITRFPRSFKVRTPFLNAAVEGTEFLVALSCQATTLAVFEGRVAADVQTPDAQRLTLRSGETTSAGPGLTPAVQMLVKPIDAVQWTLFYPSLGGPETATAVQPCDQSEAAALASCLTARAGQRLHVGRADEAQVDLQRALAAEPGNADALALLAIIDVVRNDKPRALEQAQRAVQSAPGSARAWLALSFAQQSDFQLQEALASIQRAIAIEPDNAALRARAAELLLSVGRVDQAQAQAQEAVRLDPNEARAHVALGFVNLAQIRSGAARGDFQRAIALDQANPMPRLGLGLALIREGKLVEGREQIEIAVALDPANSILRSYVAKAYYEENTKARDQLAATQYGLAKSLDPKDPTPWFYDAFLKQTQNRPVEALQDLDESIRRNDNRAVYRSRLLLDEDLAARSASQARIYNDLNFQQLALVEGWRSLAVDPTNYSAHRFLADAFLADPRAQVTRLSQLLQSQLWQPLNLQPLQPQLTEPGLFIPQGTGPSRLSYNEYNSLFMRNGLQLYANGIGGSNGTWGDDLVFSGLAGRVSFSLGQFHFQTDGFRDNNDQTRDIGNAFIQIALSADTSVQAEYRTQRSDFGDLRLRFDPDLFFPNDRTESDIDTARVGFRHDFAPSARIIGSFLAQKTHEDKSSSLSGTLLIPFPPFPPIVANQAVAATSTLEQKSYLAELQMVNTWNRVRLVSGLGYFDGSNEGSLTVKATTTLPPPFPSPPPSVQTLPIDEPSRQANLYSYGSIAWPSTFTWILGLSVNDYDSVTAGATKWNPKFGVIWTPTPSTALRAAAFRVSKRDLVSDQTIEPTQVAGFNQFFDDSASTQSTRYGIGIDQRFGTRVFGGLEATRRFLDVPFVNRQTGEQRELEAEETFNRAYLYWTPMRQLALRAEYQFDLRSSELADARVSTRRAPIGASWFLPNGLTLSATATWVNQDAKISDTQSTPPVELSGEADFWVADAQVSYRLPNRHGAISVGVRTLFGQEVRYFDLDPSNPWLYPERFVYVRLELQF